MTKSGRGGGASWTGGGCGITWIGDGGSCNSGEGGRSHDDNDGGGPRSGKDQQPTSSMALDPPPSSISRPVPSLSLGSSMLEEIPDNDLYNSSMGFSMYRDYTGGNSSVDFDEIVPETESQDLGTFSQEPESEQVATVTNTKKRTFGKTRRAGSYTVQEDKLLISAWLNTSLDAVVGTDQQMSSFWARVLQYYNQYKDFESIRNANSLMHRWSNINCDVCKFCSAVAKIEARHPSGMNEQDKIQVAKELYCSLEKVSAFQYEHCWNELRFQPKWLSAVQEKVSKRRTSSDSPGSSSPATSVPTNVVSDSSPTELRRPAGRDAENERLKRVGKATMDETKKQMYDLYENNMKNSEHHRNLKINLFSKIFEQNQARMETEDARERERLQVKMAKVQLEEKKFIVQQQNEKQKEEERIMEMDLTKLANDTAENYRRRRAEILARSFGGS